MLKLALEKNHGAARKILCLGAHADDIEIGCGGTILRLCNDYDNMQIRWVVFAGSGRRKTEAIRSAELFLGKARRRTVVLKDFRDGFFPFQGAEIKEFFEDLKVAFSPDLILTHCRTDLHQDHRLISDLTWHTFRDHLIFEYEVIKYDGDLGNPNVFVGLDLEICRNKIDNIRTCFESQSQRKWFSEETFFSILKLRGVESNAPEKFAEGFYCRKMTM